MRLVTYATESRAGVGVRTDGTILDTGYADLHALIADGARGLERAQQTADEVSIAMQPAIKQEA